MHSWVFRNRHRLEVLYGTKAKEQAQALPKVQPGELPAHELAVEIEEHDQLAPWASVERTGPDEVTLHPPLSLLPRIKRLPIYRYGA